MRIAFLGGSLGLHIGGGERVFLNQAGFLAGRGHEVILVTPGKVGLQIDGKVARLSVAPGGDPLARIGKLAYAARGSRPDIVLAHLGMRDITAAIAGRVAPKLAIYSHGGPFVSEWTGPGSRTARLATRAPIYTLVYRLANLVMTNSTWCAEAFKQKHIKAEVVYPGVDANFFTPLKRQEALRRLFEIGKYRAERGEAVFLNVGWYRKNKRHELLLDALESLVRSFPHAKVVFVGRGRPPAIVQYAAKKRLLGKVEFHDEVDDAELRLWYCASTAYVHMNDDEHFGLPIAEAQSCGTPCIVPDRGGGAEIVESGITGLLYASGNVQSLATIMSYCAAHPEEVQRMGAAARARVLEKFSQEVVNTNLESLLETTVAGART